MAKIDPEIEVGDYMKNNMTYYFSPLCPIESYVLVQFDFIRKFCSERFVWKTNHGLMLVNT